MRKVLDMFESIWNFERDMVGWRLGDRLDLLLESGDDELDNAVGLVDH